MVGRVGAGNCKGLRESFGQKVVLPFFSEVKSCGRVAERPSTQVLY